MGNQPKDNWDKLNIILTSLGAILIPVAIASIGFFGDRILQKRQESEERIKLYSELMSKREESESALRKDMFTSIIKSFLDDKAGSLKEEVLNLELLAYNFHESLNLKPLFAHLNYKIEETNTIPPKEKKRYFARLDKVASDIVSRQMYLLEEVGTTVDMTINLEKFPKLMNRMQIQENDIELEGVKRQIEIDVLDVDSKNKRIRIGLWIKMVPSGKMHYVKASWIGLYDFPTINTIRLSHDQRMSVVLTYMDNTSAEITLVYFPGSYAGLKDKPYYDDIVQKLRP